MSEPGLEEYLAGLRCDTEKLSRRIRSTKDLARIARKLNKWREVRPWLDLSAADEDAIAHDYQTTERQRLGLLEKWRERHGERATYKELAKAFDDAGRRDLVDEVCNIINSLTVDRGKQNTRGPQTLLQRRWLKTFICTLLALTALVFICLRGGSFIKEVSYRFNLYHSKSLPYPTEHFVGREVEMEDIASMINPANTDVRTVSIVGLPGIGKSALAIRIGHLMVRQGMVVHFVDMVEVSSMQALAEKVLDSEETLVATRNVTVQRLNKWARDLCYPTILILDNCDEVLHKQRTRLQRVVKDLLKSTPHLKIMMTSRLRTEQLGHFKRHELHELSVGDSCGLLQTIARTTKINSSVCESVAELTGNVPLALQVVGSLLAQPNSPEPMTIVEKLQKALIPTLSPKQLPPEDRVNASIYLSYQFLNPKLQKIGRYLANFPGSFSPDSACTVMVLLAKNPITCYYIQESVSQLVERSLLEFNWRTSRFQFHKLIRQFFLDIQTSIGANETQKFSAHFQLYYSDVLSKHSLLFTTDHVQALAMLDVERHNIQHLLSEVAKHYEPLNKTNYSFIAFSIYHALENYFLSCRFTARELYIPVKKIVSHLSRTLTSLPEAPHINFYVKLLVSYVMQLAHLEKQLHGPHSTKPLKTLLFYKKLLESEGIHEIALQDDATYLSAYYSTLSQYCDERGDHDCVQECHAQILRVTATQIACEPTECSYKDIGTAYYDAEIYEESAHFLELALQDKISIPLVERVGTTKNCGLHGRN